MLNTTVSFALDPSNISKVSFGGLDFEVGYEKFLAPEVFFHPVDYTRFECSFVFARFECSFVFPRFEFDFTSVECSFLFARFECS